MLPSCFFSPAGAGCSIAFVGKGCCFALRRGAYIAHGGAGAVPRLRARGAFFSCLRRPHFFQQRKKWGKERRQKPMVFGFPSAAGRRVLIRPKCGIDFFL